MANVISGNRYLSMSEMTINAKYIFAYLSKKGWTKNAICGALGNMQRESTINPGIWENLDEGNTSLGCGLVGWTPATKLINWAKNNNLAPFSMNTQIERLLYEFKVGGYYVIMNENYNITANQFIKSIAEPEYLASAFMYNYEKPGVLAEIDRRTYARYWYDNLPDTVSQFSPRLNSNGMKNSKYWYSSDNPFYSAGYGLPNCTCYAFGRFWEISDKEKNGSNIPHLPTGNAGTWYSNCTAYEKGSTPKLGAIIVFSDNSGGAGHVAVVEKIDENGNITTSNSAWGGEYFYTSILKKSSGYSTSNFTCIGFLYNPFADDYYVEVNTPANRKIKKSNYKFYLFKKRGNII